MIFLGKFYKVKNLGWFQKILEKYVKISKFANGFSTSLKIPFPFHVYSYPHIRENHLIESIKLNLHSTIGSSPWKWLWKSVCSSTSIEVQKSVHNNIIYLAIDIEHDQSKREPEIWKFHMLDKAEIKNYPILF